MANNRIDYSIGFKVDHTELNRLKTSLQDIKQMTSSDLMRIGGHGDIQRAEKELKELKNSAMQVETALNKAFNANLGTLNVVKFNQELKNINLNKLQADFAKAGAAGQGAFRNLTSQILTTNMQLKQSHSLIHKMGETMANTIKWGIASSVMNRFTGSVQEAWGYTKRLDTSLNNIRIVTEKSSEEMKKFATQANNAAKNLGQTTTNYTDAALIYYQQGLEDKEVAARAETTLKAANVTAQSGEEVSEQLTAVWNGYKVSAEETELYIDKLAAVAATTASDLEELSTGMSKVASAAMTAGVDIDQLSATLSTVVSVTRQAPESVGTAFKTIYARLGDLAVDGEDEFGTKLGEVSNKLKTMGVDILDSQGQMRDMGTVVEEVAAKWDTWSDAQKQAAAVAMAGKRQYNNLIALFENWDMYENSLKTSANAAGTLQKQQDIYMESTAAHLKQLKASSEDLYDSLLDPKGINPVIDGLRLIVDLTSNFVDSIGGGGAVLLALGSIGSKVFSQQIASGLAAFITNMRAAKENAAQLRAELEVTQQFDTSKLNNSQVQQLVDMKKRVLDLNKSITNEERNIANEYIRETNELFKQQDALEAKKQKAAETYQRLTGEKVNLNSSNYNTVAAEIGNGGSIKELSGKATTDSQVTKAYDELTKASQNWISVASAQTVAEREASSARETLALKVREHNDVVMKQLAMAEKTMASDKLEESSKERLAAALDKLNQLRNKDGTFNLENKVVVERLAAVEKARVEAYNTEIQTRKRLAESVKEFAQAEQDAAVKSQNLSSSWSGFLSSIDLRAKIQNTVQLVSSVGQLASAFNTIKNIGSIWSNEDLSIGEKLLQTVTNLGFALPMMATSIGQVNQALGIGTTLTEALTAAKVAQLGATEAATAIEAQGVSTKTANIAAILAETAAETTRAEVIALTTGLTTGKITAEEFEIGVNKLLAASNYEVGTSGLFAATGIKAFLASLGPIAWAFMAIGAASGAVALFDALTVSSKEAGESLKTSTEDYKKSVENLQSMNDELETTASRIKELEEAAAKGQLSLVEKEELANLHKENALLETQIELEKEKLKIKQQQVANDAKTALEKGTYDTTYDKNPFSSSVAGQQNSEIKTNFSKGSISANVSDYTDVKIENVQATDQESYSEWQKGMAEMIAELTAKQNASQNADMKNSYQSIIKDAEDELEKANEIWDQNKTESIAQLTEGYTAAIEALPALIENNTNGINDQAIKEYQGLVKKYYTGLGKWNDVVIDAFDDVIPDEESFDKIKNNTDNKIINEDGDFVESGLKDALGASGFQSLQSSSETLGVSMEDLVKQVQDGSISFKDLQDSAAEAAKEIALAQNAVEQLKTSTEDKSSLDSMFENYEDGMYLDQDEVAEILTENPEYVAYLTEVNGQYVLNEEAMRSWTTAVEEQKNAIDTLMGSYDNMSTYNELLGQMNTQGARGVTEETKGFGKNKRTEYTDQTGLGKSGIKSEDLTELWDTNEQLNTSLAEGKITAAEYMETLSKGISDSNLIEGIKNLGGEFDETTDSIEETISVIGSEVGEVLAQSNKQFQKGEMSVSDYTDILHEGVDTEQELLEATYDLEIGQDGLAKKTDEMSKEAKAAADAYNEMKNAQDELADHNGLIDMLTENAEYLSSYTDEAGNLMDSVMDDSRWSSYVDTLTSEIDSFIGDNESRLQTMAEALVNNTELGMDQARTLLQNGGSELQTYLSGNLAATQALTNASMGSVSGAITNTSSAIGSMLSALGAAISSFEYTITGTPSIDPGSFNIKEFIASKGKEGISFPGLKLKIRGEGGDNASALSTALTKAGDYFTSQGASQGDTIDDYLPSGSSPASTSSGKRPATGKSKGGGGGGGGGGSTPTKEYKESEKEKDRYRTVNNNLSKLTTQLERLADVQDRLYGKQLLNNLNKQLNIIQKQKNTLKEKLNIARAEAKEMRKSIANQKPGYKNDLKDFGVKFNKQGEITNYNSIMSSLDQKVQNYTDKWNSMTAKQQEADKKKKNGVYAQLEKAEANRSKFQELVEQYDTLIYDTIPGLEDELTEVLYQEIEIKLKKFNLEAEIRLDLTEAIQDWADFKKEMNEYEFYTQGFGGDASRLVKDSSTAERKLYETVQSGIGYTLQQDTQTLMNELVKMQSPNYKGKFAVKDPNTGKYVIDEVAVKEAVENNLESLQEYAISIKEATKEAFDNMMEAIDGVDQAYDRQYEVFDFVRGQMESTISMLEMIEGDLTQSAGTGKLKEIKDLYDDIYTNAKQSRQTAQQEMAYWESIMNDTSRTQAERDAAAENYRAAADKLQDALAYEAEVVQKQFELAIDEQIATLNKYLDFPSTSAKWELEMEIEDDYLDTINAAFGKQEFINKVQASINETDSLSAQKRLNKLRDEELAKLREKDKLTQYDLDRANQMLEIELKRIALEEAQQNKSQMRLRRDASGNYSYQFVANEESQKKAQEELAASQKNLYDLDKENLKKLQNEFAESGSRIADIMNEFKALSPDEQAAQWEDYEAKLNYEFERQKELALQIQEVQRNLAQSAFNSQKTLYETNPDAFAGMSEDALNLLGKEFKDLTEEEIDFILKEWAPSSATTLDDMISKVLDPAYEDTQQEILENMKNSSDVYGDSLDAITEEVVNTYESGAEAAENWTEKNEDLIESFKEAVTQTQQIYDNCKKIEQSLDAQLRAVTELVETVGFEYQNYLDSEADGVGGAPPDKSDETLTLTDEYKKGVAGAIYALDDDGWGVGNKRKQRINNVFGNGAAAIVNDEVSRLHSINADLVASRYKKYKYQYFDTGGYTGRWGKDGKLAVLHEKELVLNAADTRNILEVISIVRDLMNKKWRSMTGFNDSEISIKMSTLLDIASQILNKVAEPKELMKADSFANAIAEAIEEQSLGQTSRIGSILGSVEQNIASIINNAVFELRKNSIASDIMKEDLIKQNTVDNQVMQQQITINADFPNATSADEIYKAFESLENIAGQRAFGDSYEFNQAIKAYGIR